MTEREKLMQCQILLEFYDKRRNDTTLTQTQREISEKWFEVYYNLYNKMYLELNKN